MKKIVLTLGLLLLLAGCVTTREQLPTNTAAFITITPAPPRIKTSTPTITRTPVNTTAPSQVPTLTLIPIPTNTADPVSIIMAAQQPELYASYPSPDGMWRMDIYIYDCTNIDGLTEIAYEQLVLVDLANGKEWGADQQLQYCGGSGAFGYEGRYWSPNSRYFYYTDARQGVPDGCGYWEPPLSRFDTASLQKEFLGVGSLSPDGGKVATNSTSEQVLVIWNIDDGEIARVPAFNSNVQDGPLSWSPDSESLVYLQVDSWCPLSGKSYLVMVDISKPEQILLLESDDPTFGSVKWDTSNELRLFDEGGNEWRFNLLSNELVLLP